MKTDELSTKKLLGKLLVDSTITKFTNLAEQIFRTIRYGESLPVCLDLGNDHYIIGSFAISSNGAHRWPVAKDDKTLHVFYSKMSAMYYCVFESVQQYQHADKILRYDRLAGKFYDDYEFYRSKMLKTRNAEHRETVSFKYQEAKMRYEHARQELAKTLELAKYYKVWDKIK